MAKFKTFGDKDFKAFMGSLYTRVKPILNESGSNLDKMIKELNSKIISKDAKKLVNLISTNYNIIFSITVKTVGEMVKLKPNVSKELKFKVTSDTDFKKIETLSKVKIPPGMLKLYSLLMNISRKTKKLTPAIRGFIKNQDLDGISNYNEGDYKAISYLLALQDTVLIIGTSKVDKNKSKKLLESHINLSKYLKDYCLKTKNMLDKELEKTIEIQKGIHKRLDQFNKKKKNGEKITNESYIYVNPYAQEYIHEGVLNILTKPVAKVLSWMFDSSYYFFKKIQPIFMWIKSKYDSIISSINNFIFKPLYKINPMLATVAQSFLSPFTIPALVKVSSFFFGGIPGLFLTNVSLFMGVIGTINSYSTIDVRAAASIDSAVNMAKGFANMFNGMAKELDSAIGDIDDIDVDSLTIDQV